MVGWWVWVGCARVPLTEVEIAGGTEAVRAAIRDELAAFDGWVGEGRLEVARISIEPLGRFNGLYQPRVGRVHLSAHLDAATVRPVLRHELCHALDYREDLAAAPVGPFTSWQLDIADGEDLPARAGRSEVLAEACEWGPSAAAAIAEACPGEDPSATELFRFARDEVWAGFEPSWSGSGFEPAAEVAPTEPWETFDLSGTSSPDEVSLHLLAPDGWVVSGHDVWTGEPLPPLPSAADRPLDVADPDGGWVEGGVARPDGSGAAFVDYDHRVFGRFSRVLASDGEGWTPAAQVCPPAAPAMRELVVAAGLIWLAEGDGETLRWGPLDP